MKTNVRYCAEDSLPLVPQSGGDGWASFKINGTGVILNLARQDQVTVSADRKIAVIGGGSVIEEVVAAANAAGVLIKGVNCKCVGALSVALAGRFGNLVGELGTAVGIFCRSVSLRLKAMLSMP